MGANDPIVLASPLQLRALADASSCLKRLDLGKLAPLELLAFWINVYHALLIHGRLGTVGLKSLRSFVSFLNKTSYIVAGQAWSLTEIEHLILRRRSAVLGRIGYRWIVSA